MKIKRITYCLVVTLLLFVFFFISTTVYASEYISPEEAYKYIGETKTVCGEVASTFYSYRSKGKPTFINLNKPYPDQIFTIVIWGSDRSKFQKPPEIMFKDEKVCVTGEITIYRGKPQIIVKRPSQIHLKSK